MRYLLFILLATMISCSNNIEPESIQSFDLDGTWLVTDSYPTNGPICIFIDKDHEVQFELNDANKSFILHYNSGDAAFSDIFQYEKTDDIIAARGYYSVRILDTAGKFMEASYPQTMTIELIDNDYIHCSISHGIYEYSSRDTIFGEVSNFYAKKNGAE